MGPDEHAGGEKFVLQLDPGTDADAVAHLTLCLHFFSGPVHQGIRLGALLGAFHTIGGNTRPLGKGRLRLAHGLEEAVEKAHFAVKVDPADFSGIDPLVKFLLGKIRDVFAHQGDGLFPGQGIVRGCAQHHLPLYGHAVPEPLGLVDALQPPVDEADGPGEVAVELPSKDILGQSHIQGAKGVVDIHNTVSLKQNSSKSGSLVL